MTWEKRSRRSIEETSVLLPQWPLAKDFPKRIPGPYFSGPVSHVYDDVTELEDLSSTHFGEQRPMLKVDLLWEKEGTAFGINCVVRLPKIVQYGFYMLFISLGNWKDS